MSAGARKARRSTSHRAKLAYIYVYADRFIPGGERARAEEAGEEPEAIPFLKRFTVFNTDQCEDLPAEASAAAPSPPPETLILPQAEALIRATGADIRIGGDRAYYVPSADYIQVPPPSAYFEPINWHRTVFHELGHHTGHPSRLGRDLSGAFGSASYAREELVAEMTGAFVCAALAIVPTVRHADYLGAWLDVLREDNKTPGGDNYRGVSPIASRRPDSHNSRCSAFRYGLTLGSTTDVIARSCLTISRASSSRPMWL